MKGQLLRFPVSPADHHLGPFSAPITLVEYGDFSCPHCASAMPLIDHLATEEGAKLCFIFRHFPMKEIHPASELAAYAAEAADQQGAFWSLARKMFEHFQVLSIETLFALAREADLDLEKFESDLGRPDLVSRVRTDVLRAERTHVRGTPTFFLNGRLLEGPLSYRTLRDAIRNSGQHVEVRGY